MEDLQSGSISEFDLGEEPHDIPIEQERELLDLNFEDNELVKRMDDNVLRFFRTYDLPRNFIERCATVNLRFKHLKRVTAEDLLVWGIVDEKLRKDIIEDIGHLIDPDQPGDAAQEDDESTIIDLIQNQLLSMNRLLAASIIKIGAGQSNNSPGVVVNRSFSSSDAVLEILDKMSFHTREMTALMDELRGDSTLRNRAREIRLNAIKKSAWKALLVASGIIIGVVLVKGMKKLH